MTAVNLTPTIVVSDHEELELALLALAEAGTDPDWIDHLRNRTEPYLAICLHGVETFACRDRSCAPPPVGTGGSSSKGSGTPVKVRVGDPRCSPEPCVTESIERAGTMGRALMHRAIVKSIVAEGSPPPTVTLLGGGGGSGKTTVAKAMGLKRDHEATINADDIKEKIPDYKTMVAMGDAAAAAFVHEESSKISKDAQAEARRQGVGVTLDQVGSNPVKVSNQIEEFLAAGYTDIRAVYIAVDTDVAVQRAMSRGERTGRVVPETTLRAAHRDVSANFETIARNPNIGEIQLIDNNGSEPFVIARGGAGRELEILDPVAYTRFLEKGV
jgi:predicted ABC-type ATPase